MNRKKRLLFIGEASYLATGFSTYWAEVLKRLHATGEFEIAELGSYAFDGDPRNDNVPWKFYPVAPNPNDGEGQRIYNSDPENQFGKWRFDQVCLDWKPDIVLGIRDYWMDCFVEQSPYKKHFAFFHMPTVDGSPQREQWLDFYGRCEKIFTYSDYGKNVLENESRGTIKVHDIISPCADIDIFKPVLDKGQHKLSMGIDPNAFIVGTTMRNQKRKLFYDLIEGFADWYHRSKSHNYFDIAKRTYLYLHTSYPDVGFDIGKAIAEFKIGNRVLMTYICGSCGATYPAFFQGAWAVCRNKQCNQPSAHPPNPNHGVSREILSSIYNLFDVYVQYSICEGYGMPLLEAASCGVPRMAVNYSAMEDHVKMPGGIPINVERFFYESVMETEQRRALPNNRHFGDQLKMLLKKSAEDRKLLSQKIRQYIVEPVETLGSENKIPRCSWDRAVALWAHHIRTYTMPDVLERWDSPIPIVHNPNLKLSNLNISNMEFVNWAIKNILADDKLINSFWAREWCKALNTGFKFESNRRISVDRNYIGNLFLQIRNSINNAENFRVQSLTQKETTDTGILVV